MSVDGQFYAALVLCIDGYGNNTNHTRHQHQHKHHQLLGSTCRPELKKSIPQTFHKFPQLPPEVRQLIWHHALDNATAGRIIHVSLIIHSIATFHYCLSSQPKIFCGERENCSAKKKVHETKKPSQNMSDGFFYGTIWFPEPETAHTATAMSQLSLACHEARKVLVRWYPKTMRVYQEAWSQGVKSRLVRCNPATDVLVITSIAHEKLVFPYETMPGSDYFYKRKLETHKEEYPSDAKLFAEFRDLVSSWENVAFYYAGCPPLVTDPPRYSDSTNTWTDAHLIEGDPWDFEPFEDANPRPSNTLPDDMFFQEFVPYLQSLKRLVAWPHPKYWPELRKDAIVIDDVKDISFAKDTAMPRYVNALIEDARSFLKYYRRDAKIHNALFMNSDEHWAVKAKPITRVGSFVAPSWVAGIGDIEGPVGNRLDEEQSEEDEDSDGDEYSEDYSEEEDEEEDEEGEDDYSDTDGEGEGSDEDFEEQE